MKYVIYVSTFVCFVFFCTIQTRAIDTVFYQGVVEKIESDGKMMRIAIRTDEEGTKEVKIPTFADKTIGMTYTPGDKILVSKQVVDGQEHYAVSERDRSTGYAALIALFAALVILIGRLKGLLSLIAMLLTGVVITQFTIPQIIEGVDPIIVSMLTAAVVIPVTFYFSHGLNRKTTLAIYATILALFVTGLLSLVFMKVIMLTGMSSDEADAVFFRFGSKLRLSDVLIAGMIISAMGVLDDVTISQVSIVQTVRKLRPDLKPIHLFATAMEQGRDHIASLVNTLLLVYAGAALPLFILVTKTDTPWWVVLQKETIAEEIVRTFVSSIGIILAVPIATAIAVKWGKISHHQLQKEKLF
jgi:uncharacterized membrane protein